MHCRIGRWPALLLALAALLTSATPAAARWSMPATDGVAVGDVAAAGAIAARPTPSAPFRLERVGLDGSSLSPDRIAAATKPFIGTTIDDGARARIVAAIDHAYLRSDIALYTILDPNRHDGGVLRFAVIEGYVGNVEIRGRIARHRLRLLGAYVRKIQAQRPLHTSRLRRYLSLIRALPGFTAKISLEQSDLAGVVTLVIDARQRAVQGAANLGNRGLGLLGRTQMQVDMKFSGVLTGNDQLDLSIALPTRIDRFQAFGASYAMPVGTDGTILATAVSIVRARPDLYSLKGSSLAVALRLDRPLLRDYDQSLTATLETDIAHGTNRLFGYTLSNERTQMVRSGLFYNRNGTRSIVSLATGVAAGHVASDTEFIGIPITSRHFAKFSIQANGAVQIGRRFVLRLAAAGQLSGSHLPSTEQFVLGGETFGRGYETASVTGDTGYAGSAEIVWQPKTLSVKDITSAELYMFSDAGKAKYEGVAADIVHGQTVASAGVGARIGFGTKLLLQMEAAKALDRLAFAPKSPGMHLYFGIRALF